MVQGDLVVISLASNSRDVASVWGSNLISDNPEDLSQYDPGC